MGACASLPKGMREEAMAAPAPEPLPAEGSIQADQHNTEEVIKVEKEENKAGEEDESKQQLLGSLLDDQPQPEKTEGNKEANDQSQQAQVEAPAEPKKEEAKVEAEKEEPQAEAKKEEAKVEPKKEDAKPEQALAAAPKEIKE